MNFSGFTATRYSDCLIAQDFASTGCVLMYFAKGRIDLNKQIFVCISNQGFQYVVENLLSAPKAELVINAVPVAVVLR